MNKEPAVTVATITAVVGAGLGLAVAFGVPLTEDQKVAILAVAVTIGPVVVGFVVRHFVTPTANVVAYQTPSGLVVAGEASPEDTGTPVDVERNPLVGVADDDELEDEFVAIAEPDGFDDGSEPHPRRAYIIPKDISETGDGFSVGH